MPRQVSLFCKEQENHIFANGTTENLRLLWRNVFRAENLGVWIRLFQNGLAQEPDYVAFIGLVRSRPRLWDRPRIDPRTPVKWKVAGHPHKERERPITPALSGKGFHFSSCRKRLTPFDISSSGDEEYDTATESLHFAQTLRYYLEVASSIQYGRRFSANQNTFSFRNQ